MTRTQFVLADLVEFLRNYRGEKFDACVASGVLYHLVNPMEALELISMHAKSLYLYTHYYDSPLLENLSALKRTLKVKEMSHRGRNCKVYRHHYNRTLKTPGFCGGVFDHSYWMAQEDILSLVRAVGFSNIKLQDLGTLTPPSLSLVATR